MSSQAYVGGVYAVRTLQRRELELALVTAATADEVRVWPVSEEVESATDRELLVDEAVLGFRAMLVPHAAGALLPEQLDESLGTITPEARDSAAPGPPVLHRNDVRPALVDELIERWEPYYEPAASLSETITLGELVALRRRRVGLEPEALAALAGSPATLVADLERDTGQRPAARALAAILGALGVMPSRKLGARIRLAFAPVASAGSARLAPASRVGRGAVGADSYAAEVLDLLARLEE